jgi:hypothetical protein
MALSKSSHQPVKVPCVDRKLRKVNNANDINPKPSRSSH